MPDQQVQDKLLEKFSIFKNWKKIFFIFTIFYLLLLATASFWVYINKDKIRKDILDATLGKSGMDLSYESENLHFFPYPGISLYRAEIFEKQEIKKWKIQLDEFSIRISWNSLLLKNISIKKIKINQGTVEYYLKKNNAKETNTENASEKEKTFLDSIRSFNLSKLDINKLSIKIKDDRPYPKEQYYIKYFQYSSFDSRHLFDISVNHGQGSLEAKAEIEFSKSLPSLQDMETIGSIKLKDFPIKSFKKYYSFFRMEDFNNTIITGDILFQKEFSQPKLFIQSELKIFQLNFKEIPVSPELKINSKLSFQFDKNVLHFENVHVLYGNFLEAKTKGKLEIGEKRAYLFLDIEGEKVELLRSLQFILSFLILDLRGTNPNYGFKGELLIHSREAIFDEFELKNPSVNLYINNAIVKLDIKEAELLRGKISGQGIIDSTRNVSYDFKVKLQNIDLRELIEKYSEEDWIAGKLYGELNLRATGVTVEEFTKELIVEGKLTATNGQLLGYADFFRPILALGKFINFQGPKGKSTEFQSLALNFLLKNKNIEIDNLKMVGVGIDANGKGSIDLDKNIQFRLIVSLGGIAGKAILIPIIYSGIIPNNKAYIDPVWLGSVYLGATFLGGPVGGAAGGVAGSAIAEYIRNVYEKLTSIFNSKDEEKK